jgi:hypothetical protein
MASNLEQATCPLLLSLYLKLLLSHYTLRRRLGERRYSFYSFLTSVLDRGEWSASRPGRALASGKGPPVLIVQEAGWASAGLDTEARGEFLCLCRSSSPLARHYTD